MARKRKRGTFRSSTTAKGWSRSSPDPGPDRRALAKRCGLEHSFLKPDRKRPGQSDYPIVASGSTSCAPNCKGLLAAFQRSRARKQSKVATKAVRRAKAAGCKWARSH